MADRLHLHFPDDHPEFLDPAVAQHLTALGHSVLEAHPVRGLIDIVLTDNKELHRLNSSFRGMDRPTDVLSFSLAEGQPIVTEHEETVPSGEIYISVNQAQLQAEELDVSLQDEVGRLMVHGILHLAGYNHDTEETLRFMEHETQRFLDLHSSCPGGQHI